MDELEKVFWHFCDTNKLRDDDIVSLDNMFYKSDLNPREQEKFQQQTLPELIKQEFLTIKQHEFTPAAVSDPWGTYRSPSARWVSYHITSKGVDFYCTNKKLIRQNTNTSYKNVHIETNYGQVNTAASIINATQLNDSKIINGLSTDALKELLSFITTHTTNEKILEEVAFIEEELKMEKPHKKLISKCFETIKEVSLNVAATMISAKLTALGF